MQPASLAPSVLNIEGTLQRLQCTRQFYREMLALFHLHDTHTAVRLRAMLVRGEHEEASRISHRLAGAASMIGAEQLTAALLAISEELRALPPADEGAVVALPAALLADFDQTLQTALAAVVQELQNGPADSI